MMILIVNNLAWLERTLPDCESCQEQPKEDLDISGHDDDNDADAVDDNSGNDHDGYDGKMVWS